ncbi:hypothetical protein [Streptomyces sp. SID10853]|nr:hypothetical protein [Streptomyces sp. SID10853]
MSRPVVAVPGLPENGWYAGLAEPGNVFVMFFQVTLFQTPIHE